MRGGGGWKRAHGSAREALPEETGSQQIGRTYGAPRQSSTLLARVITIPLTQGEFDALVSLCFNLKGGARSLPRIAPKLVEKLISGDRFGASIELLDINRVNGEPMLGLTRRREAERVLFVA